MQVEIFIYAHSRRPMPTSYRAWSWSAAQRDDDTASLLRFSACGLSAAKQHSFSGQKLDGDQHIPRHADIWSRCRNLHFVHRHLQPKAPRSFRRIAIMGGLTWPGGFRINQPVRMHTQGSQPVFLPDGRLAIVYWNFGSPGSPGERLEVVVSNTAGTVFSAPRRIANAVEYIPPQIRSGTFLPAATVDRTSVESLRGFSDDLRRRAGIFFTKSTDAGTTWTAPVHISNNTGNTPVFNPAIATSPDGRTLTVSFYDGRANPGRDTLVDMFLALSINGGATWQPNIRLTSVSTNASLAPLTSAGYMLGDYLGIAESTRRDVPAVPVWIDTRTGGRIRSWCELRPALPPTTKCCPQLRWRRQNRHSSCPRRRLVHHSEFQRTASNRALWGIR